MSHRGTVSRAVVTWGRGTGTKHTRRHSTIQNLYPAVMRRYVLAERSVYAFATRRCQAGTQQHSALKNA